MSNQLVKQNGQQLTAKPLPKYNDLVNMEIVNSNENDFQVLLNQEPPPEWIKTNKYAGNSKYIPIDKVEYLLTRLFVKWWTEVIEWKVIANSVGVHVRLFYISPITGETLHQDGLGAMPLQTDEGKGATDFNFIKTAAVQMALPGAESYAIKDAAEKIGRLFGKDLNRKDTMAYENLTGRFNTMTKEEIENKRLEKLIEQAQTREDLEKFEQYVTAATKELFKNKMAELV